MFGLDYNNTQPDENQTQPNQYSNGNLQTPDNTSWMQPSQSFQNQQNQVQSPQTGFNWTGYGGNTGFAGNAPEISQARQSLLQPGNGTAIDATNYGWMMPSFGFGGFNGPNNNSIGGWQNGSYYDFGMTPPGGWNTQKNPNADDRTKVRDPGNLWNPPSGGWMKSDQPQQGNQGGNVGQYMPGDVNMDKWNDPNKHDPKYDTERILSKYAPGSAGLDQAMPELEKSGYKRTGKDSIYRPDVGTVDVGFAFSENDPNKMKWGWMPKGDNQQGQQQTNQTPMINPNQQIQSFLAQLMNSSGRRGMRQRLMRQQGSQQGPMNPNQAVY